MKDDFSEFKNNKACISVG